jgi:hypothetical protein
MIWDWRLVRESSFKGITWGGPTPNVAACVGQVIDESTRVSKLAVGGNKGALFKKATYAAGPERLIHVERVDDARHAGLQRSSGHVGAAVVDNLQCKADCS